MNYIPTLGWIVDEWFSNPIIHDILQNVIQVLTRHRWVVAKLVEDFVGSPHDHKMAHSYGQVGLSQ
jgi:hypothetical protein